MKTAIFLCINLVYVCAFSQVFYEEETIIPYSNFSSVVLDGSVQYISAASEAGTNDFALTDAFSVEMWVKPIRSTSSSVVLIQKGAGSNGWKVEIIRANTAKPQVRFQLGLSTSYLRATADLEGLIGTQRFGNMLSNGFYYHIVATYDGSQSAGGMELYINQILATTTEATNGTPIASTTDSLFIGRAGSSFFHIGIALVRIYGAELTQANVSALYNSGAPNRTPPVLPTYIADALYLSGGWKSTTTADIVKESKFPGSFPLSNITRYDEKGVATIRTAGALGMLEIDGIGGGYHYLSPVSDLLYQPVIAYDGSRYTYIAGMVRGGAWLSRQSIVGRVDHVLNQFSWFSLVPSPSDEINDGHQLPSMHIKQDGDLILIREDGHFNGVYVAQATPPGQFSEVATFGGNPAYNTLFELRDTIWSFFREDGTSNDEAQGLVWSADGGANWSSVSKFLDMASSPRVGAYPHVAISPVSDTVFFFVLGLPVDGTFNNFTSISAYKSADMVNFYAMDGTSVGVRGSNTITGAEVYGVCLVDSLGGYTLDMNLMCSRVDTSGKLHLIYYDESVDSVKYAGWGGTGWEYKNLDIEATNFQEITPTAAMIYKGGTAWDYFQLERVNGFDAVVRYSTNNEFSTLTDRIVISEPGYNYTRISAAMEIELGDPVTLAVNKVSDPDNQTAELFLYVYTPN